MIHYLQRMADHWFEGHFSKDIPIHIHARGNLHQFHALHRQRKHAAFGDIQDGLFFFDGISAAECDMFHLLEKFMNFTLFFDSEPTPVHGYLKAAGGESAYEYDLLGILADVDESAGSGQLGSKLTDVEITVLVRLGQPEKGQIQPTPVVEVELRRLIDDRLGVGGSAEVEPARRQTANDTGFRCQGDIIENLLFIGDTRYPLGHADSQVDHAVGRQLKGGPSGNDLPGAHPHGFDGLNGDLDFAAEGGVVFFGKCLPVVFRLGHHHTIHHDAGYLDLTGVQGTGLCDPFHLDDNKPPGIFGSRCDGKGFQGQGFLFHGDVAVGIRCRSPQQRDVDRQCFVGQVFVAVEPDQFDDLFRSDRIDLPSAVAGIHEGAKPDGCDGAGFSGGDIPVHVRDDALGKVVGGDFVVHGQLLQFRHQAPMAPDYPPDQSLMTQVVEPPLPAVPLTGSIQ